MQSDVAIKIDNLSKSYKLYDKPIDRLKESLNPFGKKYHNDFCALRNISFNVIRGKTVGIIGQNGSGKSTLLKVFTGIVTPSSGQIEVNGKISALLELGAGFNPEFTGRENIYLNGAIMGFASKEMREKMSSIEQFAELGDFIDQPIKLYSSGMFVRLAFACAVNVEPDILIVDEALAVGDMQFQLKCISKMKGFKKEGKTILFVTHDTYSVRNFCDEAIWMMDGKIHRRGDVNSVTESYQDFMKFDMENTEITPLYREVKKTILSIDKVSFNDFRRNNKKDFEFGEVITVNVEYTLSAPIEGLIGGVAIFDKQNTYVCGLNTKLDNYSLASKPGKYQLSITYEEVNLLPGTYFIDVAFFESSGVVTLDCKRRVDYFRISPTGSYFAEGLTHIKHHWQQRGVVGYEI